MGDKSSIEWTGATWNPTRGCSKASEGCRNCYAMRQAHRFSGPGKPYEGLTKLVEGKGPQWIGEVRCIPEVLEQPLRWKKPRKIFVDSMSDLFHPDVPFEFVDRVFAVMALCPRHIFQVLTKRPERMREYINGFYSRVTPEGSRFISRGTEVIQRFIQDELSWRDDITLYGWLWEDSYCGGNSGPLPNVWPGTSVEDQDTADERIPHLLQTPAAVRWLSMEPLLGAVDLGMPVDHRGHERECIDGHPWPQCLDCSTEEESVDWTYPEEPLIHWVVAGGESGPGARAMHPQWVRSIRDQCQAAGVPFFFKQWGAWAPFRDNGPLLSCCRYVRPDGTVLLGDPWDEEDACMGKVGKKAAGRELDGRTWNEYPEVTP